jgi:methylmalonic aciduria homocystinuria type C protein
MLKKFLSSLESAFASSGLDLFSVCRAGQYHDLVDKKYWLPCERDRVVVLVGNTKRMWPFVCESVAQKRLRAGEELVRHPVDSFVEESTRSIVAKQERGCVELVRFVHDSEHMVLFQQLASASNLCWVCRDIHLAVHPNYGGWVSFRVALVLSENLSSGDFDMLPPVPELFDARKCCGEQFDAAMADHDWKKWLAVRDSIPVGKEHRFSEDQIMYHYTGKANWKK